MFGCLRVCNLPYIEKLYDVGNNDGSAKHDEVELSIGIDEMSSVDNEIIMDQALT